MKHPPCPPKSEFVYVLGEKTLANIKEIRYEWSDTYGEWTALLEIDGVEAWHFPVSVSFNRKAVHEWLDSCQEIVTNYYTEFFLTLPIPQLQLNIGSKYIKVINLNANQRSVWAFIDKATGDILRPSGWVRPAAKARGNLFDAQKGLGQITAYGPNYLR